MPVYPGAFTDRTPTVLPHLHELARTAPDQPRRHRGEHRGHHHPHRAERARRTRHHHLPHRGEDPRRADERATRHRHPAPPRLAPRMELHPQPTPELSVSIIGKPLGANRPYRSALPVDGHDWLVADHPGVVTWR